MRPTVEKAEATLRASLDVDCPKCLVFFDVLEDDDEGDFLTPIFNNRWDELRGREVTCPECGAIIELTEIIW